jgi:DNA-directed RNA polymerase subunit RPC12/RpoP
MIINRRLYFCFKCNKTRAYKKVEGGFKCKTCGEFRMIKE